MVERSNSWRDRYKTWFYARPQYLQKIIRTLQGIAIWAVILVVYAALAISNKMSSVQQLTAPLWIRAILWILGLGVVLFLATCAVIILRMVITNYVGSGNERDGWKRFAISAVLVWFGLRAVHTTAYWLWTLTPLAAEQQQVAAQYTDMCTVSVQDDENSGHIEDDWHAGAYVCAPLKRRLHSLYPTPAWLFGSRPTDD